MTDSLKFDAKIDLSMRILILEILFSIKTKIIFQESLFINDYTLLIHGESGVKVMHDHLSRVAKLLVMINCLGKTIL